VTRLIAFSAAVIQGARYVSTGSTLTFRRRLAVHFCIHFAFILASLLAPLWPHFASFCLHFSLIFECPRKSTHLRFTRQAQHNLTIFVTFLLNFLLFFCSIFQHFFFTTFAHISSNSGFPAVLFPPHFSLLFRSNSHFAHFHRFFAQARFTWQAQQIDHIWNHFFCHFQLLVVFCFLSGADAYTTLLIASRCYFLSFFGCFSASFFITFWPLSFISWTLVSIDRYCIFSLSRLNFCTFFYDFRCIFPPCFSYNFRLFFTLFLHVIEPLFLLSALSLAPNGATLGKIFVIFPSLLVLLNLGSFLHSFLLLSSMLFSIFSSKSSCSKSYSEHCFEPLSVLLHSGLGRPAESQ